MNTTIKAIWNHEFFTSIKKLFQENPSSIDDDLTVHTSPDAILELANILEGKGIPVVLHLIDGRFFRVTIVKILNGTYFITEESSLLKSKATLIGIKEILSMSVKDKQ